MLNTPIERARLMADIISHTVADRKLRSDMLEDIGTRLIAEYDQPELVTL